MEMFREASICDPGFWTGKLFLFNEMNTTNMYESL